jgi:surface protein
MAFPELNPFVKADACQTSPSLCSYPNENARLLCVLPPCAVTNGSIVNDNDCVCGTGTCTVSTGLFCKLNYCATGPFGSNALPNGDGSISDPGTGLRKVVSDWISGGAAKNTVLTTYGPIEDWNISHVTSLAYLFYNKNAGSPDISKWNTGVVITMEGSKFLSTDVSFACGNCFVCCCSCCC